MAFERALPLALGALAVPSGLALLTFDILFSISLRETSQDSGVRIVAIVASGLEAAAVTLFILLVGRQIRYRNGSHIQDFGHGRKYTYLLAGIGAGFGVSGAVTSATLLGLAKSRVATLERIMGAAVNQLVVGGFIAWAVALCSQAAFVICMVAIQQRDFQQQIQPYRPDIETSNGEEMELPSTPKNKQGLSFPEKTANFSRTPPSTGGRSRSGSDAMNSIRSSLSQAMRPATSKTKLINKTSSYRAASTESHRETIVETDDGFDSWDTSTVDAQSRHAVESASPTPPRFLETIPASPTTSRSPSPGFPLDFPMDLEPPPKIRRRSRSLMSGNSFRESPRSSRGTSPEALSAKHESHIHPLFRTDSMTPPPSATPGTNVNAAPGAGLLLSDVSSIRSLRMRSGSLPTSPLSHSASLDSLRFAIEKEEREREWAQLDLGGERTLTPPIPDFVLNGTPRSSMMGYSRRKISARGLDKMGGGNEI